MNAGYSGQTRVSFLFLVFFFFFRMASTLDIPDESKVQQRLRSPRNAHARTDTFTQVRLIGQETVEIDARPICLQRRRPLVTQITSGSASGTTAAFGQHAALGEVKLRPTAIGAHHAARHAHFRTRTQAFGAATVRLSRNQLFEQPRIRKTIGRAV